VCQIETYSSCESIGIPDGTDGRTIFGETGVCDTTDSENCFSDMIADGGLCSYSEEQHHTRWTYCNCEQAVPGRLYFPSVCNNFYGATSSITLQNPGGNDATVDIKYRNSSGTSRTITRTVPANGVYLVTASDYPDLFFSSVVVESTNNQPIIGVSDKSLYNDNGGSSFPGLTPEDLSTTLYFPSVCKDFYGATSSITLQNPWSTDATVDIIYSSDGAEVRIENRTILANSLLLLTEHDYPDLPFSRFSSVTVESTNDQPIIGVSDKSLYNDNGGSSFPGIKVD
jgi:hypothetical protein